MKKSRPEMIRILFTVAFALMTLSDATLAEEQIQQSCNAYYENNAPMLVRRQRGL